MIDSRRLLTSASDAGGDLEEKDGRLEDRPHQDELQRAELNHRHVIQQVNGKDQRIKERCTELQSDIA